MSVPTRPEKQQNFATKYALTFPLLADEDHAVADAGGTRGDRTLYRRTFNGSIRSAFVIDEPGKVAATFYTVSPKGTVGLVTEASEQLPKPVSR